MRPPPGWKLWPKRSMTFQAANLGQQVRSLTPVNTKGQASSPKELPKVPPEVCDRIRATLRMQALADPEDLVFLGGSRVSGLGNVRSDIDVFIVTDRSVKGTVGAHLLPIVDDELPLDVEVWSLHEVRELIERLCGLMADGRKDHRAFMHLLDEEREFLHDLITGLPLQNSGLLAELQRLVPGGSLQSLSLARAVLGLTNSQVDLMGWLAAGDWQASAVAGQRIVEFAALALLSTTDCTHPGGKWLIPLLRRHADGIRVPSRLLCGAGSLSDRAYELTIRPASELEALGYACDCVEFANSAVLFAQTVNGTGLGTAPAVAFWHPTAFVAVLEYAPRLSPAVQIRFHDGQWLLIDSGRHMFELNEAAAAIALLLDGRHEVADIVSVLGATSGLEEEALARSTWDVIVFLDGAGLLLKPNALPA